MPSFGHLRLKAVWRGDTQFVLCLSRGSSRKKGVNFLGFLLGEDTGIPLLRLLRVELCVIWTSGVQKKTVKCSVVRCCSLVDPLGFYKRCCARQEGVIISFENWHRLMCLARASKTTFTTIYIMDVARFSIQNLFGGIVIIIFYVKMHINIIFLFFKNYF